MEPHTPLATELSTGGDSPQVSQPPLGEEPFPSAALPPAQPRWPDKPWLKIWTAPRGTMRAIVDADPTRHVLFLAAVGGVSQSLDQASGNSMGDSWPIGLLVAGALLLGSLGGILSLYIGGALFRWTGSLFGGRANSEQVRAALAWSLLPRIAALVLWVPYLALYGQEMFTSYAPRVVSSPQPLLALSALDLALGIWSLFLIVKTVAEVHRFSAWRALAALAMPFLVLFGLGAGCALALLMARGGI